VANWTDLGSSGIAWEHPRPVDEQRAVQAALTHPGLLDTTLARLVGNLARRSAIVHLNVRYLATGGAKRVYMVTAHPQTGEPYAFVLKQFCATQLVHLPPGASVRGAQANAADLEARALEHMVWAAQRVDETAPGLCPRFGGLWEWSDVQGQRCRVMTEAYIAGYSLERWKVLLEDAFIQGRLDFSQYSRQRQTLERQAIAAYMRLWAALGRRTFTSDPSPWNVLLTPTKHGFQPSIIDLHSIHEGGSPLYVFQTLEELFGSRDEIRQEALCPGILDALGRTEGVCFLDAVRCALVAQSDVRDRTGLSSYAGSIQAISHFLESLPTHLPEVASMPQRLPSGNR
jgi:hypothetical protein